MVGEFCNLLGFNCDFVNLSTDFSGFHIRDSIKLPRYCQPNVLLGFVFAKQSISSHAHTTSRSYLLHPAIDDKPPMKLENNLDYIIDSLIAKQIIEKYKNHSGIKFIQDTFHMKKESKIEEAKAEQVNKILRNINSRKATGPDKIPPKIVKMSADIIDSRKCIF